jgi:transcriptional regulator with XRE-family HTH domain
MLVVVNELGEFLRARRARLRPADVGLPGTLGRRRTPGLRREELATLAGVSATYYARIEQGRERNPGVAVVEALADALLLDVDAREHLRVLAAVTAGRPSRAAAAPAPHPDVERLLDRLRPWPALLLTRTSDVLAANLEGLALFPGLAQWPPGRRNTVRYVFAHPAARSLFDDWERAAADTVAGLRSRLAADPDAPDLAALRDELRAGSAEFRRIWDAHDVRPRRHQVKVLHHPQVGRVELSHLTLRLPDDSARVSVYQPVATGPSADAVALLALDPANG